MDPVLARGQRGVPGTAARRVAAVVACRAWRSGSTLAFRKSGRSLVAQLIAVAGLTLTAPATWYTATGNLNQHAWLLWGLNFLYFAGGVLYVKMHVAAAARRKPFETAAEKISWGGTNLTFYGGMALCVVGLAMARLIPWLATLAFVPVVVRQLSEWGAYHRSYTSNGWVDRGGAFDRIRCAADFRRMASMSRKILLTSVCRPSDQSMAMRHRWGMSCCTAR